MQPGSIVDCFGATRLEYENIKLQLFFRRGATITERERRQTISKVIIMKRAICDRLLRSGFVLVFLLGIMEAVPTPPFEFTTTSSPPEMITTEPPTSNLPATISTSTMSNIIPQIVSVNITDDVISSIVDDKSITETSIIIQTERMGRAGLRNGNEHHTKENILQEPSSTTTTSATTTSTTIAPALTTPEASKDPSSTVQVLTTKSPNEGNQTITKVSVPQKEFVEKKVERIEETPKEVEKPVLSEKDKMIQRIFGGECNFAVWSHCSRIRFWGGDYLVPDKKDPEKMIVKHHKIRCVADNEQNLCLRNGWTIARCHMLCMSQVSSLIIMSNKT